MDIFEEVKKLNLPLGKYVVVGSGIMAAKRMRNINDIDLLVTEDVYEIISKQEGWTSEPKSDGWTLTKGIYEIDKVFKYKEYNPGTDHLIKTAEIINGIPFMQLSELVKFKEILRREKDLEDIELIKKYLENGE